MKLIYILFLFISFQSYAQEVNLGTEKTSVSNSKEFEVVLKTNNSYAEGSLANIPAAVLSTFKSVYKGATHITCFVADSLCSITFLFNDETTIVKYKPDGSTVSVRKTYSAEKLDRSLAAFLEKEVKGLFKVKFITELEQEGARSFNINLSSEKEWMNLKLATDKSNGQIQVVGRQVSTTNYN